MILIKCMYLEESYYWLNALRLLSSRNDKSFPRMEAQTPVSRVISAMIFPPTLVDGCLGYGKEYLKRELS